MQLILVFKYKQRRKYFFSLLIWFGPRISILANVIVLLVVNREWVIVAEGSHLKEGFFI